jgi:hypothetical protein
MRQQFHDDPDPAARRQAMHEMRAWRRAQVDPLSLRGNAGGQTK